MTSGFDLLDDVHALKCELAGEVLRSCGSLRLRVTGWSMLPAVWPGDTLFIERAATSAVIEGDIVLFGRDQRLFAHRIVKSFGNSSFLTRGDAMPQPDPVLHPPELLGRVSSILRNGKCIAPRNRQNISARVVAALIRRSHIAARVLLRVCGRHRI